VTLNLPQILDSLVPDSRGGFSLETAREWTQGRTLYGGLNAALAARVARAAEADLGPLRSAQVLFMAPAAGRLRYVPSVLRHGRSVSCVGVDTFADDELCARATFTYGRRRESDLRHDRLTPRAAPAPLACPELQLLPGTTPEFLNRFEVRFAAGSEPMSGGDPRFAMWVRHREADGVDAESAMVAVADVLPPAVLASRTEFRPASSVTWMIDFVDPSPDPGGWYLLESGSDSAADGYSRQAMSCWDAEGRLAAVGRQTVAYF
jgi:acyl-CoA thioesterase